MKTSFFNARLGLLFSVLLFCAAAQARDNQGATGHAAPIQIRILSTNEHAGITLTEPQDGDVFAYGTPITVSAIAFDPFGYIPRLEFYSGTNRIGVSEIHFVVAPPPGTPIVHSILWSNAPLGTNILTARGMDSRKNIVRSNPVRIQVFPSNEKVLLAIEMLDSIAAEPTMNDTNTARFQIARVGGPTNEWVSFLFHMNGSAQNTVDYQEVRGYVSLAPNQLSTNIFVQPLYDELTEGDETVVITLYKPECNPPTNSVSILPFVPIPSCYAVRGTNVVTAVIRDRTPSTNRPPIVRMTNPTDGSVFEFGQSIHLAAHAEDPDGTIQFTDLLINDRLFWRTNSPSAAMRWDNPPLGEHTLRARAIDNLGSTNHSAPVRILVRAADTNYIRRELPAGYSPAFPFEVRLSTTLPPGVQAWGVEDRVPQGWQVTSISHGGIFDALNNKVKFGHFTDSTNRILAYQVTAPLGSTNVGEFGGLISIDGRNYPIFGSSRITPLASEYHPADGDRNRRMILSEVTGYAAAWKRGTNWPAPPNPIPASYVTRAAHLWRQGEVYHFVATNQPPLCWVPDLALPRIAAIGVSTATRTITAINGENVVKVDVLPGIGVTSYTVEEHVPDSWIVSDVNSDGVFDATSGTIRWGLFLDSEPRTLVYRLIPTTDVSTVAQLTGQVTLDGKTLAIAGAQLSEIRLSAVSTAGSETFTLSLTGGAGQICVLEQSNDLVSWTQLEEVFLPGGFLNYVPPKASESAQRFYRLRTP